jgi:threonine dehydrogenase-like Zn-dependent dehydrogenase
VLDRVVDEGLELRGHVVEWLCTYLDPDPERRAIAKSLGAQASAPERRSRAGRRRRPVDYDVVVEATSRATGLRTAIRALAPGGVCTAVGYYPAAGTRLPLMRMYATDATLQVGVSHARAVLPELLAFLARTTSPPSGSRP